MFLYYDIADNKKEVIGELPDSTLSLKDPNIDQNGKNVYFIGCKGYNENYMEDIYKYNIKNSKLLRLTHDGHKKDGLRLFRGNIISENQN